LGFDKNVLVQASCHGKNNDAMVDCLMRSNGKARGVAIVDPDISDQELERLDRVGVRGVRFNFLKRLVDPTPKSEYLKIAKRVAKMGWHVVVYFEAEDLEDIAPFLVSCPERLTIAGPPYDDVVPFAKTLVQRFPDRVLWGTDWPHPNMKTHTPDDGLLVDRIPNIATTPLQQFKLLVQNPMRLYWPGHSTAQETR